MKKMKKIQVIRLATQLLFVVLTIVGLLINLQTTILIITITTFVAGAYYCGWICPFGTIQDLYGRFGRILGIKKRKLPKLVQKVLVLLRYLMYALFMLFATDLMFTIIGFDPRSNFSQMLIGRVLPIAATIIIISFTLISLFFDRPFCNYFCIEGAKYGLMSTLRIFTIKRDKDKCINCKLCDKACPMNIEVSKATDLRNIQCINCFECTSACPIAHTLSYGLRTFDKKTLKYYRNIIAVAAIGLLAVYAYPLLTDDTALTPGDINEPEVIQSVEDPVIPAIEDPVIPVIETPIPPEPEDPITPTVEDPVIPDSEDPVTPVVVDPVTPVVEDPVPPVVENPTPPVIVDPNALTDEELALLGDAKGIDDGIYTGSAQGYRGLITVEVTVTKQMITSIVVVSHREDMKWYNRGVPTTISLIIGDQSTGVDAISGATFTSQGIIEAVADALASAR